MRRVSLGDMPDYMTPHLRTWRRWTDGPLLILAIGSLPLLLLELKRGELPYSDQLLLDIVNVAVTVHGGGDNGKGAAVAPGPNHDQGWGRVNLGSLLDGTTRDLRDQLDTFWARALATYEDLAESKGDEHQ